MEPNRPLRTFAGRAAGDLGGNDPKVGDGLRQAASCVSENRQGLSPFCAVRGVKRGLSLSPARFSDRLLCTAVNYVDASPRKSPDREGNPAGARAVDRPNRSGPNFVRSGPPPPCPRARSGYDKRLPHHGAALP